MSERNPDIVSALLADLWKLLLRLYSVSTVCEFNKTFFYTSKDSSTLFYDDGYQTNPKIRVQSISLNYFSSQARYLRFVTYSDKTSLHTSSV